MKLTGKLRENTEKSENKERAMVTILASAAACLTLVGCGVSNTGAAPAPQKEESTQAVEVSQTTETAQTTEAPQTSEEETEGEVDVVLDEGIEKYEGNWYEEIAGRGYMEISPSGDGKYYIEVTWGSSAAESDVWTFTAIYDSESGDLIYDDGSYQSLLFDENGGETVQDEKDVHGKLHLVEENKLEWTDSAYDSSEPSVFLREQ